MEKRNSKKIETNKMEKKDRGDNQRKIERTVKRILESAHDAKVHLPDRGDSGNKNISGDKSKVSVIKKPEDLKLKVTDNNLREHLQKKIEKSDPEVLNKDRQDRIKVKDKNSLKIKNHHMIPTPTIKKEDFPKINVKLPPEVKHDRPLKKPSDQKIPKEKTETNETEKSREANRRPIIRTVTAKNDSTKIFKAVTFAEHKRNKATMLHIKIPNETRNVKNQKMSEMNSVVKKVEATVSRLSVKEKQPRKKTEKRKKRRQRNMASPDLSVKVRSPPTEVAKWAPSSINKHTKPYYEAWVSTTLAAISKNARKDKLFMEKQSILQSFQKALAERPDTPELVYEDFKDERYTGRIKVKHR